MKRAKDSKIWGESNHETPGTTRKGRTRKPCLWRFRLFEYFESFVVLPRVTTKDSKYSKRRNRQRQGFLVLPFRVVPGVSWLLSPQIFESFARFIKRCVHTLVW